MKLKSENININDLIDQKYMHKEIKKDMFLTEYQIEVLDKYNINPYNFSSIKEIIFEIDSLLDDCYEVEELENVLKEIEEFNYYANTNK
ncbi:MAG: hypothetical protein GX758_03955 [Tenericutes bacterium]|nr:hypothetical protein [Mycoplasmatota bacterium]